MSDTCSSCRFGRPYPKRKRPGLPEDTGEPYLDAVHGDDYHVAMDYFLKTHSWQGEPLIECHLFPESVTKQPDDWCGQHQTREGKGG
jgi:hypothetical protein